MGCEEKCGVCGSIKTVYKGWPRWGRLGELAVSDSAIKKIIIKKKIKKRG